jgi:hypothetical protein
VLATSTRVRERHTLGRTPWRLAVIGVLVAQSMVGGVSAANELGSAPRVTRADIPTASAMANVYPSIDGRYIERQRQFWLPLGNCAQARRFGTPTSGRWVDFEAYDPKRNDPRARYMIKEFRTKAAARRALRAVSAAITAFDCVDGYGGQAVRIVGIPPLGQARLAFRSVGGYAEPDYRGLSVVVQLGRLVMVSESSTPSIAEDAYPDKARGVAAARIALKTAAE